VDVDIEVNSVDAGSAQANQLIEGPALFDVAHYPEARFQSRRIVLIGDHLAQIDGDLTLHGVTRPISLTARLPDQTGADQTFTATTHVQRSAFGMVAYHPLIGDTVALTIQAVFSVAPE
jgi:polyisoprenoid-binding protein YceI